MTIGSAVFAQGTLQCPITLQWAPTFPPKLRLHLGGWGPRSNTWYLGPTRVSKPNGISIGSAVFVWLPNGMLHNALSMGKKTSKNCPFSLGLCHSARGGLSHGNRQYAQKNLVKIAHVVREICTQTDTHRQTDIQTCS